MDGTIFSTNASTDTRKKPLRSLDLDNIQEVGSETSTENLITDEKGNLLVDDVLQLHPVELMQSSKSKWRKTFRIELMDFLFEQYSLAIRKALEELRQSQVLRAVLAEDGPARRTRSSSRRFVLDTDKDISAQERTHDNEAGTSGTTNSQMETE